MKFQFTLDTLCSIDLGVDYIGGDLKSGSGSAVNVVSINDCCMNCVYSKVGCHYFTYDGIKNICYLKSTKGRVVRSSNNGGNSGGVTMASGGVK